MQEQKKQCVEKNIKGKQKKYKGKQKKDIKDYLAKKYMSILPHQHLCRNFKQGHPCQPPIKNYIYNSDRKNIKYLLNVLNSLKELSYVAGDNNVKQLLFLISQDEATSEEICKNADIYKKDRNLQEFNFNRNTKKMQRFKSL